MLAVIQQFSVSFNTALIEKATTKHNLTDADLRQIPDTLANPVMGFTSSDRSTNFEHGFVVVTQIRDADNNPVLIPGMFQPDVKGIPEPDETAFTARQVIL